MWWYSRLKRHWTNQHQRYALKNRIHKAEEEARRDPRFVGNADRLNLALCMAAHSEKMALYKLEERNLTKQLNKYGILVPLEYQVEDPDSPYSLTDAGQIWAKKQIYDTRLARCKDWFAMLMSLLSAIIAILSLLVALHKK